MAQDSLVRIVRSWASASGDQLARARVITRVCTEEKALQVAAARTTAGISGAYQLVARRIAGNVGPRDQDRAVALAMGLL